MSGAAREELRRRLLGLIEGHRVVIFSKTYCPHSTRVGGQGPGPPRRPAPASVRARPIRPRLGRAVLPWPKACWTWAPRGT